MSVMDNLTKPFRKVQAEREQERIVKLEDDIILGETIRTKLGTEFGAYLIKKMEHDLAQIKKDLVTVDPTDENAIRNLQSKHFAINSIQQYIADAIKKADAAQSQLDISQYKGKV